MRAIPSLTSRTRADFFDVELVEVRRFDLAEEDVLDFAGAERGFGGHVGSGLGVAKRFGCSL